MKKLLIVGLCLCFCLWGCGAQEYETVADEYTPLAPPRQAQVVLSLSQEAVDAMHMEDALRISFCDGYWLTQQTFASGDLESTLRAVTGYSREKLNLITQTQAGCTRYDFVWSCAGEGGMELCRGSILDDGSYHYVVTAMAPEEKAGELTQTWNAIFGSFSIAQEPADTAS